MFYYTPMFTPASQLEFLDNSQLILLNSDGSELTVSQFDFLDDICQPILNSYGSDLSVSQFEFLDGSELIENSPTKDQPPTGFTICETYPEGEYRIYGFTQPGELRRPWSSPLYYEKVGGNYPKARSNFTTLEDKARLTTTDGLHACKNQKFYVFLSGFKNIVSTLDHVDIMLEAKLVWNTNKCETQTILSLSKTNRKKKIFDSNPNAVVVLPKISKNDCSFKFYLLKHCFKTSKDRCYLHIILHINGIKIELAKYYVIIHNRTYTYGFHVSKYIENVDPFLKTGFLKYPTN